MLKNSASKLVGLSLLVAPAVVAAAPMLSNAAVYGGASMGCVGMWAMAGVTAAMGQFEFAVPFAVAGTIACAR